MRRSAPRPRLPSRWRPSGACGAHSGAGTKAAWSMRSCCRLGRRRHGRRRDLVVGITGPDGFRAHAWLEGDPVPAADDAPSRRVGAADASRGKGSTTAAGGSEPGGRLQRRWQRLPHVLQRAPAARSPRLFAGPIQASLLSGGPPNLYRIHGLLVESEIPLHAQRVNGDGDGREANPESGSATRSGPRLPRGGGRASGLPALAAPGANPRRVPRGGLRILGGRDSARARPLDSSLRGHLRRHARSRTEDDHRPPLSRSRSGADPDLRRGKRARPRAGRRGAARSALPARSRSRMGRSPSLDPRGPASRRSPRFSARRGPVWWPMTRSASTPPTRGRCASPAPRASA